MKLLYYIPWHNVRKELHYIIDWVPFVLIEYRPAPHLRQQSITENDAINA